MIPFIEIGGQVNSIFRRNIVVKKDNLEKELLKYDFKDTYTTIYEYDSRNQNTANYIAPLYIDLDAEDLARDFELIKRDVFLIIRRLKVLFKIKDENIDLYFSGSKGFHILVPYTVFGLTYGKDINKKYKSIAVELKSFTISKTVDTRIYDNKRLFRMPNTINSKTGLYKIQLTIDELRNMDYKKLMEVATSKKDIFPVNSEKNSIAVTCFESFCVQAEEAQKKKINNRVAKEMMINKELLPCVKYILANGANKGGRNNTAMALASALHQRDSDSERVLETMKLWNVMKLDEPLSEREIEATTKSAYNNIRDGRRYGCGAFMDLGICVKGCPVRR